LIVNQKKNASFRTTLEYVLGKEKSTLIDTNMGGETPRQLAAEFAAARRHRPNLKRACGHIIISIPHREADHSRGAYHEHLDSDQYVELARRWLQGMEFLGEELSCSQYLIARHHDTLHEHIHIIASRIRMDGSVVSDSWDYRRSEVIVRQLEKEFNLEPTPCSNERVALIATEQGIETTVSDRRAPNQKQKHHHSGKPTVKQQLAALIDEACSDSPTVTQLIGRLQHQGVKVFPQFSTRGLFKEALAFELDGLKFAGNKLGSAYSFPGLQKKRGVSYNPERDMPAIEAAAAGELVEPHESEEDNLEQAGSIERSRVERVLPIVKEFFKAVKDGQQFVGTNYTLRREGDTIRVIAMDGRGEVLRLTGQGVEMAALEDKDVMLLQQALERRLAQKQQKSQQRPISPSGGLQL
jgi:hypothetical protein